MAAELGLLSLTQIKKLAKSQQIQQQQQTNPNSATGSGMWNPNEVVAKEAKEEDTNTLEVKAFVEDTSSITWSPRSHGCTFCGREFRSAQALGGHMNVHRRDRARLHQPPPASKNPTTSSSTLIIPNQELDPKGGLRLMYSIRNPNGNGMLRPSINLPVGPHSNNSSLCPSNNNQPSSISDNGSQDNSKSNKDSTIEELDLELRLGRGSLPI